MMFTLFWIIGVSFILLGLLYIQKPTWVLAFWRRWHILSSGKVNTSIFGAIVLILGIGLLIYSFFF